MTLNRGDKLRYLDKRRGSMPFAVHQQQQQQQHLHRRSMPVDERELQASLPPSPRGELSALVRCTSYPAAEDEAHRQGWASDSSDSFASSGSDSENQLYKVILLGEHGVGKTSLARIFGGVEDCLDAEEAGNTYDRSIIVDGEEASLVVFDIWEQDDSQWLQSHCMKMGDAYIIVYSVTDKVSFEKASELRIQLRRARQTEDIPIILVGNKSDLVRSREVSVDEGRACAVVFDCKFIETSAALHHNVKDLFEGIVRQIRLRKDSKEDNARRMANTKRRESISKKAKRFLGRIVAKNNKKMAFKAKSKSCHDLSVL
uniref:GTP-binding protein n=1 Tax=Salvator merianae TaxID=96440 RepID=A0A8D0DM39_SALMN